MTKTSYAKDNRSAFLPRDAMHNRGLCCRVASVCPSVRLSGYVSPNPWLRGMNPIDYAAHFSRLTVCFGFAAVSI